MEILFTSNVSMIKPESSWQRTSKGLLKTYVPEDWKLFVDSSRGSLKVCIFTQWKSVCISALSPFNYDERKVRGNEGSFGKDFLL